MFDLTKEKIIIKYYNKNLKNNEKDHYFCRTYPNGKLT